MPGSESITFHQVLAAVTFERLAQGLSEIIDNLEEAAIVLREPDLGPVVLAGERLVLVVSPRFRALLRGQATDSPGFYLTELSFTPETIAAVLEQWRSQLPRTAPALALVKQAIAAQHLHPNDAHLQSQLTLKFLSLLAPTFAPAPPEPSPHRPWEANYPNRPRQEQHLLDQISGQIQQQLDLPVILTTALDQGRQWLQVDRLVIYQFTAILDRPGKFSPLLETVLQPPPSPVPFPAAAATVSGWISYEARASTAIPSILNLEERDSREGMQPCPCRFDPGWILAIADIEQDYHPAPCLLELLRRVQVRAKLAIPILVHSELWGLLIGHQCFAPRQWQTAEIRFLQRLATHLAIAIAQAQLSIQIQQQKQTLEQRVIQRTQELHEALLSTQCANRAKNDFLATMSHELRTPLTCVIGMSATLLRWPFGPLNEKQRSYLKTIHDSGEHLLELINDILELSLVEAGKAVLNLTDFSLTQLARQSLQLVREKAQTSEIELRADLQIPPDRDRLTADRRRVKQILFNLLTNAIKFTPAGGQVTLRVWVEANSALFQVEDTGIGIPLSQQPLLFQKFQQLDTSYKRRYEGTGLGLALTKQLVELHRGWIEVDSVEGKGSIFTVEIPVQGRKPTPADKAGNADAVSLPTGRIVLIEDQEETATMVCDMLTAAGYQVVWLIDGAMAMEQIQFLQPIAVITDLELPEMDGFELIQRLRSHSATQHLKILVLTHQSLPEDRKQCLAAGADAYLSQPIRPEHLLHKIATLLASPGGAANLGA